MDVERARTIGKAVSTCESYELPDGTFQCGNCGYVSRYGEAFGSLHEVCPSCGAVVVSMGVYCEPDDSFWC